MRDIKILGIITLIHPIHFLPLLGPPLTTPDFLVHPNFLHFGYLPAFPPRHQPGPGFQAPKLPAASLAPPAAGLATHPSLEDGVVPQVILPVAHSSRVIVVALAGTDVPGNLSLII